jgi:NADPH:quinone reductase-like Zn-dependent oxidoreductase
MKAKAIRIHQFGGPEVLKLVEVDVADPGPTRCASATMRSA